MNHKRRTLLKAGAIGGAAVVAGLAPRLAPADEKPGLTERTKRILILGGTGFIGPHMVGEFLRRGHEVTLFNRGRTNNALFPDLVTLIGDRNDGLAALQGHRWDVVVDNSGYVPRHVADSARMLADAASHYIYVSTISAYASLAEPLDEDAPLATIDDETIEQVTNETYGPLKALCEKRAAQEFGEDRLTILRPTYICGPGDRTDRYTYWPVRTMRGGDMVWPGTPEDEIQIIDVRDLANFTVDAAVSNIRGTFNTVTPVGAFTMGDLLNDCLAVTAAETTPVWMDSDFLDSQETGGGNAFPIWVPPGPEYGGAARCSGERAVAAGLYNRPTRETARDTVTWWKTLPAERTATTKAGLAPDVEAKLIENWRQRNAR